MTISQLSVFIENKQGALARLTAVLAAENIDIRAMSLAETQNFGVLRLIVNDTDKARTALEMNNIVFHITQVIAVSVDDKPGGLAKILSILAEKNIDIMYMYAFLAVSGSCATVVLRIQSQNRAAAVSALTAAGIRILNEEDASRL